APNYDAPLPRSSNAKPMSYPEATISGAGERIARHQRPPARPVNRNSSALNSARSEPRRYPRDGSRRRQDGGVSLPAGARRHPAAAYPRGAGAAGVVSDTAGESIQPDAPERRDGGQKVPAVH